MIFGIDGIGRSPDAYSYVAGTETPIEDTQRFERMVAQIFAQIIATNYQVGFPMDTKVAQYAMNAAMNSAYLYCSNYDKVKEHHKEERIRLQSEKEAGNEQSHT